MKNTQFQEDLTTELSINGTASNRGFYNLVVSIRDLKLYKAGIKPHRFWKISDVKNYFGLKGNVDALIERLTDFKNGHFPKVPKN